LEVEGVEALLERLVATESINPGLDESGSGEAGVEALIHAFCDERKLDFGSQNVLPGRRNALATVAGRDPTKRVLFVAHMDTVPVQGWRDAAFIPLRQGRRLIGRGSADTKASLAAMLIALDSIKLRSPGATVVVAGSVDEEFLKSGADRLAERQPRFTAAVIGEPTNLELVVAHKGSVRWTIEARGRAAHSSQPHLGVNAINAMSTVIQRLRAYARELEQRPHQLVGPPTLTVSLIKGGSDICTVPDRCEISLDRRLIPGESPIAAKQEIDQLIAALIRSEAGIEVVSSAPLIEDPPVGTITDKHLVEVSQQACRRHAGTGEPKGVPFGTDASRLAAAGIPCIIVGPGSIEQAHTVGEFVDLNQLAPAVAIYRDIMLNY
jgi:acetylornithine deacetylase/succinyl-diaminopimelate desuccinylase-like protein